MTKTTITIQHAVEVISIEVNTDKVREFIEDIGKCSHGELRYLEFKEDSGKVYVFTPGYLNNSLITYTEL